MLNYYTKFLGLDGKIDKELTLVAEDKTRLEKEIIKEQEARKKIEQRMKKIEKLYSDLLTTMPNTWQEGEPIDEGMLPPVKEIITKQDRARLNKMWRGK